VGGWTLALVLAVVLVPASELALGLLHHFLVRLVPPTNLPRLQFARGVPADCATFVVMPSMLVRPESARVLLERLEMHYLASGDPQLRYALLTDFADAPREHMPEDDANVKAAIEGVNALNQHYCQGKPDQFFLFHRRRTWNPSEGCWMGWERKRGKLTEFNRLLRGARDTNYTVTAGDTEHLPHVRYVITLDADTRLPLEMAARLIATLSHPLNRPRLDPSQGRVVSGFGVLQPRIGLTMTGARKSLFARIFSGSAGIDPYTVAVSDVYQDLFGIGSFTGKGIYDVDAFEAALGKTFPENRILSHDLIEGNYARCGLVTDVELLDEFPARYHTFARREHRWVRGDWQILGWLFPWVPGPGGVRRPNPLPLVERWKVFDNLRRSVLPPLLVLLLFLGWTVLPGAPWFWTALVLAVLGLPLLLQLGDLAARVVWEPVRRGRLPRVPDSLGYTAGQVVLKLVFLADQALLMVDAVARTLFRLFVSRRRLLVWETAASTERRLGTRFIDSVRQQSPSTVLTVAAAVAVTVGWPGALPVAGQVLALWLAAPAVAHWVSRLRTEAGIDLNPGERQRLRRVARKTWLFFETFVGAEDHWLPPDNYQEDPKGEVAHRTSPTNIGLYLLSCVAAHDFGYLSLPDLLTRLERVFDTLEQLEQYHGHILNWYDTTNLKPLPPAYVSTVDSGNLLGCLVVLSQALREVESESLPHPAVRLGLADTLGLAREALRELERPEWTEPIPAYQALDRHLCEIEDTLKIEPQELPEFDRLLTRLEGVCGQAMNQAAALGAAISEEPTDLVRWLGRLKDQVHGRRDELGLAPAVGGGAADLLRRARQLATRADALRDGMDFRLLYNHQRHLFSIGFNLSHGRLDNAHYDLLASEAALTSFLAVARGAAPRRHWFQLARPLTQVGHRLTLVSWSGTMFEYLMPRLLLAVPPGTLLSESQRGAVARQAEYGRQCGVPWGVSESAFAAVDAALNYQYQAFGVPGLGLKRGLGKELVVAPYATLLAVMIDPRGVLRNCQCLGEAGAEGVYGYYESLDYTPDRRQREGQPVVVKCFMAHHQGMSLVALANCLLNDPMTRRFHAEPAVRAAELLLQERIPQGVELVEAHAEEAAEAVAPRERPSLMSRRLTTPHTGHPRTHLLSNGRYTVMVTNAGAGYSNCEGLAVTRWREDRTLDHWGQFCYVRDLRGGAVWSAGHQPVCRAADDYEVTYSLDKAEFRRLDGRIETRLEITVSPEHRAEVRRVTFTNHDHRPHVLEVTSYAEVVLGPAAADLAHPAFGKLFLETERAAGAALLCRRRPRSPDQKPLWAVHVMAVNGDADGDVQFETDRGRFLGRGRSPAHPAALDPEGGGSVPLSGTTGAVLDPVFSLRRWVRVAPDISVTVAFTTAVADGREEALALADQYADFHGVNRAFELAWAHSQVELRHLQLTPEEAQLFQRLAAHLIFSGSQSRAPAATLAGNRQGQSALWRHGISGDLPMVLARFASTEDLSLVRQLLAAHTYWRLKGLVVDLVFLNEDQGGYLDELQHQVQGLVRGSDERGLMDRPGGVFVRKAAQMPPEDHTLLLAAAHVVLDPRRGPLARQLDRLDAPATPPIPEKHHDRPQEKNGHPDDKGAAPPTEPELRFANGVGGFTPDGREYVLRLTDPQAVKGVAGPEPRHGLLPPAPWTNVVANPDFGFLVSETGASTTWAGNSQTNRLTPWHNDPVTDPHGEVVYLRDEATGAVWTPTPLPVRSAAPFVVRHGQGYTVFEHSEHGIRSELLLFVPVSDPVKVVRLRLRNTGRQARRLSVVFFAEWVLGTLRDRAPMQVVTGVDEASGALLARNHFRADFSQAVAFADVSRRPRSLTADRTEFLGRNGSAAGPAALENANLSGAVGAALDPCAALQTSVDLGPGAEGEVTFLLGEAAGVDEVRRLLRRYGDPFNVEAALGEVRGRWDQVLGAVQVRTPDPALDVLVNRWLPYQVLACRVWGRTAFYQSGGAYGFRDQLQDVLALVHGAPAETRAQLLRAAGRQFPEGDVQHWWHPPSGAGVRTRFSDDLLWLPFAACHYVAVTGDLGVLEEVIPFLQAPPLAPEQEDDYRVPEVSEEKASLYEHCVRAVEHGSRFGEHGLPLMGTGDWNDGMNRVGRGGKGESVWNAWFLLTVLRGFADVAERRGDHDRARLFRERAQGLSRAVEAHGWDGHWYRRAYFDDGTPLGSARNDECRIDSVVQSWAVIAGAGDPERARKGMAAVGEQLVRERERLILLFTPPFDQGRLEPGYIKGYLPGIRENGGQYTHAALWVVQATALLGHGDRAAQLLDLVNPVRHTDTPEGVARYRVEPYVLAADVYSNPQHVGRGGWTWYTGSAGWFYRVALETVLGFQVGGNRLSLNPCVPRGWREFEITYRYRSAVYLVRVENPNGVERGVRTVALDGRPVSDGGVELTDDGQRHEVRVQMG
jgi:cyclic beta-1,2-glucan synthetase